MFALGIALIALGLFLAYLAGADDKDLRDWHAEQVADQYAAAMAAGKGRHPSHLDTHLAAGDYTRCEDCA